MRASEESHKQEVILELDHLAISFDTGSEHLAAVRDVSLSVRRGEALGIVGESGSGKSVSLMGALGLSGGDARIVNGSVRFRGRDVSAMSPDDLRNILGKDLGIIFQNPTQSLNPVKSIGNQIVEAIQLHDEKATKAGATKRAVELLEKVGITQSERRLKQYPHEFSGGMCQRVMIAIAIANSPHLLIADEATTAVDATIQAQILELLRDLHHEVDGGLVIVSHDLGVIAEYTDNCAVMYAGRVAEIGPTDQLIADPRHPYTRGLLSCRPSLRDNSKLEPVPGQPPGPGESETGCPFRPRCPVGRDKEICAQKCPPLIHDNGRGVACHFAGEPAFERLAAGLAAPAGRITGTPIIELSGACVDYPGPNSSFGNKQTIRALHQIYLKVRTGESWGIVGESGSGKSTLAKLLTRLEPISGGQYVFDGQHVKDLRGARKRAMTEKIQMVFQDPHSSLNPRLSAGDNAAEPMRIRGIGRLQRRNQIEKVFAEVGLSPHLIDRSITDMSGGQLQRVGIARGLVLNPEVLVLDEPVSALDVSIQAQILNLLNNLRAKRNLTYLFISHDLAVVKYIATHVAVMNLGKIVEKGTVDDIVDAPTEDYTRALLSAVPEIDF